MENWLSQSEAEAFAESFDFVDVHLSDPGWAYGFEDLEDLWIEARGDRTLPGRQDIDITCVPKLVPRTQIYIFDPDMDLPSVEVNFQGSGLNFYTDDETGTLVWQDLYPKERDRRTFLRYCRFITSWPHPVWGDGNLLGIRRHSYRREKYISLPLSSDGRAIDGILTASVVYQRDESAMFHDLLALASA